MLYFRRNNNVKYRKGNILMSKKNALVTTAAGALDEKYTFRDREKVLNFLDEYPFLMQLLMDAYPVIRQHFPYTPLTLRLMNDPEMIGDTHLLILITTDYGADETLQRLDRIDEDWWLGALEKAQGKLSINVDFR